MEYLDDILKSITTLGPEALTVCAMIALGYVVRLIPSFPNKWIPVVCIFGAPVLYPFLTSPGRVAPDVEHPIVRIVLTGFLIGVLAWILHDKILARIEDKIPFLKGLLASADLKDSQREVTKAVQTIVTETSPKEKIVAAEVTVTTQTAPAPAQKDKT